MAVVVNSTPKHGEFFGCKIEDLPADAEQDDARECAEAFAILKPRASRLPLVRIGPDTDGGYLLPDDLNGIAACFSPGVGNRKGFEDHLSHGYGIRTHMCDFTSDERKFNPPLFPKLQTFKKLWLDVVDSEDSISLDSWVREMEPTATADLILQMDIEGAEYRNILSCDENTLKQFRIMIFELHGLDALLDRDVRSQVILPFLRKIGRHFSSVHVHPNNCCGEILIPGTGINIPKVLEITFIRNDRQHVDADSELYPAMSPHPDDIAHCVPGAPPLYLNKEWFDGSFPWPARLRRLEDEFAVLQRAHHSVVDTFNSALGGAIDMALRCRTGVHYAGDEPLREAAVGKTYFTSSAHPGTYQSGTVPSSSPKYFFHTKRGAGEYITVDLGTSYPISSISIENRKDACFERARLLFALAYNHISEREETDTFRFICGSEFTDSGVGLAVANLGFKSARYVSIVSPLYTSLHLSSLRVYVRCRE